MGFLDIIKGLIAAMNPPTGSTQPELPNRFGTFIAPDVYPRDLDNPRTPVIELPPFSVLPGLVVMDKEVVGCYVKASEGLGWGSANEDWFRRCWRELRTVGGSRYGTDWFRGCYHFLRFQQDGARQADYFMDLIESAGGWDVGDLVPWVDIEEGGQGTWSGGERLERVVDQAKRRRLVREVTDCASAFVSRVRERRPGIKVGVYGRGLFRDLGMTACRFGADVVCNPAWTERMPPMDGYGWPLADIVEWQLCGDGAVAARGFPSELPGWGKTDYSAFINGAQRCGTADIRRRCLAHPC